MNALSLIIMHSLSKLKQLLLNQGKCGTTDKKMNAQTAVCSMGKADVHNNQHELFFEKSMVSLPGSMPGVVDLRASMCFK